jgi:hypothetical protein
LRSPLRRRVPFFKKSHNAWYVELDRQQIRLAETEGEAFERCHERMAAGKKGTTRTVRQAVQRLMRWGEKSGRTPHPTLCDYEKPGANRRTDGAEVVLGCRRNRNG